MAKQKTTQVTVQGLATNPNPNALPAGSCAVAQNVISRRPGILTPVTATIDLSSTTDASFYPVKLTYSDSLLQTLAIEINNTYSPDLQSPIEAYTGRIQPYTANQSTISAGTALTVLKTDALGTTRNIGFYPGIAFEASSHFRSLITEKWGIIANLNRWAGLPPSRGVYLTVHNTADGWLAPTASVGYIANFTLESTDANQPYVVNGPMSGVGAIVNLDAVNPAYTTWDVKLPNEPLFPPTGLDIYLNIYRCSQAVVDTVADLGDDFRRIAKIKLASGDFGNHISADDIVVEDSRNSGTPAYTNSSQEGANQNSFAPPTARDICVFKDTVFYANRSALPTLEMRIPGQFGSLISTSDYTHGIGVREIAAGNATATSAVVTASAADLTGAVPGQVVEFTGGGFPPGVITIVSKLSPTSIQVSAAATITEAVTAVYYDVLKVKVHYADSTTTTSSSIKVTYPDSSGSVELPGFRILHGPVYADYGLNKGGIPSGAVSGASLTLAETFPAVKRVSYFEVFATNGQNYSPAFTGNYISETLPLQSQVDNRANRVFFSKTGQPECVPPLNYLDVGAGTILKMWANQTAIMVFCTDGLWRITGDGTNYAVFQVDPTVSLLNAHCVTSLNNKIYAWVQDGISTVTEDAAITISTDALGPYLRERYTTLKPFCPTTFGPCMAGDQFFNEVWINTTVQNSDFSNSNTPVIIYNDDTKNFTTHFDPGGPTQHIGFYGIAYSSDASRLLFIRKNNEDPTGNLLLQTKCDFYNARDPDLPYSYLPALVWFNPLQTDEKGNLKQWIDVNYFLTAGIDPSNPTIKCLFDTSATETDSSSPTVNTAAGGNASDVSRGVVHFFVPRRAALGDQIQIGFSTDGADPELLNFQLQGFTIRYRVASDTLKRQ